MKTKILKYATMSILFLVTLFSGRMVYAEEYVDQAIWLSEKIDNIYIRKVSNAGYSHSQQAQFLRRSEDNQFVYCLEPFVDIDNNLPYYQIIRSNYAKILGFTEEQWERISLLAYYGYQYNDNGINHSDQKWYAITQVLIWRTSNPETDTYFTDWLNGNRISKFESEIAELESLVANHYKQPKFESDITLPIGSSINLSDSNNVLSNYRVTGTSNVSASINGNQLTITGSGIGDGTITLEKKTTKYEIPPIVYINDHSQNVMSVGNYDPVYARLNVKVLGGRISITKKDYCGSTPNDASLQGAIYGIYDVSGNKVTEITTDVSGEATSEYLPSLGKYYIQEIKASNNYLLDSTRYEVELTAENTSTNIPVHIDVKEHRKAKISLVKVDSKTGNRSQGEATLKGAVYDIFDINGNRVGSMTTDENGRAISGYLPDVGTYTVKEVKPSQGYNLDPTVYTIVVEEEKTCSYFSVESKEKVITNTYEFTKLYSKSDTGFMTSEVGVTFAIYNSRDEKIAEFITDSNGKFKTTLPYGSYILRQLTSTSNFNKVDDYHFEIREQIDNTIYKNISNSEIIAKLKVVKIDSETKDVIKKSGIKFKIFNIDKNEYVCQNITYPTSQKVCVFETDKNGEFITPYELSSGRYRLEEVNQIIDGYLWNTNSHLFEIGEDMEVITDSEYGIIFETLFSNTRVKGEFNLHKNGEKVVVSNGKMTFVKTDLKGIIFGIYARENIIHNGKTIYHKGDLVTTIETDSNGNAKYSNMYLGKYYVKELQTLPKYELSTKEYDFELKYKDQYTAVVKAIQEINNYLITKVYDFTKTDMVDDEPIEGALIELYTENGELIYSGRTDKDGKINFTIINSDGSRLENRLPIGRYYILEKEAPYNYLINEDKIWFEVTATDTIVKSIMKDERVEGTVKIHKDGEKYTISDLCEDPSNCFVYETEKDLEGIKFGLYAREDIILNNIVRFKAGDLVAEGYTNQDGNLVFEHLYLGKYYVKELETKDKYVLDTKEYDFILEYADSITPIIETSYTLKNYLIKSDFEFTKTDISESKALPNTLVEIYTDNDELVYSGRTDENGKIIIKRLPKGKYYILEKEAPEGYKINEEKMLFEIKENGGIVKSTMKDEDITGSLKFTKLDFSNDNPLPNTLIEIYNENDELVFSERTDENGKITIDELKYGKYYILEKEAPEGYEINLEKMWFEIKEDGEVVKSVMKDHQIVEVPNTDATDYKEPLISGIALIVLGTGVIVYGKKKNKK